jgi:hypothetical protein
VSDLVWNPADLKLAVTNGMDENLSRAGKHMKTEEKKTLSKQGSPIPGKKKKIAGRKNRVQERTPSEPGEPPHKFTGRLQRGVKVKMMKKKGRVRITAVGGNLTEYGTKDMAARPHLRPTLAREKAALAAILTTPVP